MVVPRTGTRLGAGGTKLTGKWAENHASTPRRPSEPRCSLVHVTAAAASSSASPEHPHSAMMPLMATFCSPQMEDLGFVVYAQQCKQAW